MRRNRDENGTCCNCGKVKKCQKWCWGPKESTYLWLIIEIHKRWFVKLAWDSYKDELKWAGTEPWHRYE